MKLANLLKSTVDADHPNADAAPKVEEQTQQRIETVSETARRILGDPRLGVQVALAQNGAFPDFN